MRHDMKKVLCERPRAGFYPSHKTGVKLNPNLDWDSEDWGATKISSSRKSQGKYGQGRDYKCLNDFLSPLKRFLFSSVGRNWDHVYSEIRKTIDCNSVSGNHLLDHIRQYVRLDGTPSYIGLFVDSQGFLCEEEKFTWVDKRPPIESLKCGNVRYILVHICRGSDGCRFTAHSCKVNNLKCVHSKPAKIIQSNWFVEERHYHDVNEIYKIVKFENASARDLERYHLCKPGDIHIILYKDVPEHRAYLLPLRQANRKEMKLIRSLLRKDK